MTRQPVDPQQPWSVKEHCDRRRMEHPDRSDFDPRPWGIALSGGGIRSATFCFGLIKALAKQDIFRRFDLMSTVSGGGYIGSTIGKLYQAEGVNPAKVQEALADADGRQYGAWLRVNGRYLIPGGFKDALFAAANFGRNLLGIHVELALLSIMIGTILLSIDLLVWQWADCVYRSLGCRSPSWLTIEVLQYLAGPPPVWLVLPVFAWVGVALAYAYWVLPTQFDERWKWRLSKQAFFALVAIALVIVNSEIGFGVLPRLKTKLQFPPVFSVIAIATMLAWLAGIFIAALLRRSAKEPGLIRNRLTSALSATLLCAIVFFTLGAADYLAWSMAHFDGENQSVFGMVLAVMTVALRVALPKISDLPKSLAPWARHTVLGLLNVVGIAVLLFVVIFWMSWVHKIVSDLLFFRTAPFDLRFGMAYEAILWMLFPAAALVLLSARNQDFLNRSSLFFFYRARIVRSYLGAANPDRFRGAADNSSPFAIRTPSSHSTGRVADVHPADDVPMKDYAPNLHGGPAHLINVCINQTRDPDGGLFNRDRKGLLLTIGPNGQMCVASRSWNSPDEIASLSLGSWIAISGAAIAPGLGASTRMGVSALLMLSGVRLGYWWDSRYQAPAQNSKLSQRLCKYGQFFNELSGRFDGIGRRDWFLSDGGHFENTAAYALLREECSVIVVADCGADPRYSFGDLENLVRKARIDLQADITFLRPRSDKEIQNSSRVGSPHADTGVADFGSLNELASADSHACLALARINYLSSGKIGYMVIVKPNMCQGAAVDLVNFKADNPLFPQEPTTDQFFSEAQWESYFLLGQALGRKVRLAQLLDLPSFALENFVDDDGAVLESDETGGRVLKPSPKRLSSRIASTGAVSASLSIGAIASIGLATWELVSKEWDAMARASRIEPAMYKELTDIFGKLGDPTSDSTLPNNRVGEMATALLRVGDVVCTNKNLAAFKQSEVLWLMLSQTKKACASLTVPHPSCSVLTNNEKVPNCLQNEPSPSCVPTYWIRDYNNLADFKNCLLLPKISASRLPPPRPPEEAVSSDPAASQTADNSNVSEVKEVKKSACSGKTIYVQIYSPASRDMVNVLRETWQALGATVPRVEDVNDSARRSGQRPPRPFSVPTVLYHSKTSEDCAETLRPLGSNPAWAVRPLPANFKGRNDVIEVWIPPGSLQSD